MAAAIRMGCGRARYRFCRAFCRWWTSTMRCARSVRISRRSDTSRPRLPCAPSREADSGTKSWSLSSSACSTSAAKWRSLLRQYRADGNFRQIGSSDHRAIGPSKFKCQSFLTFNHPMTRSPDDPISPTSTDGLLSYSFVIPAYNESVRIRPTLDELLRYTREQDWDAEILVVNDGSSDDTAQIVRGYDKLDRKSTR